MFGVLELAVNNVKRIFISVLLFLVYGPRALSLRSDGKKLLCLGLKNRVSQFIRTLKWAFHKDEVEICYQGEFGPELKWSVPYAYWHYLRGTLKKTVSYRDTADFYFFSPCHEEVLGERAYVSVPTIPNTEDHNFRYSLRQWVPVPYKSKFKQDLRFQSEKPIVVISNKFNDEWGRGPVNYLAVPTLVEIVRFLESKYQVIYNRPEGLIIVGDHNVTKTWDDKSKLKDIFPHLNLAEDIFENGKSFYRSFNHFQLALYANCERFISVQGGNSVLTSYFGGTNIVYCKEGFELEFHEYENFYGRLSEAKIVLCKSEVALLEQVKREFS